MADIDFGHRGKKGNQGMIFSGPTAAWGYQTQYHAPLQPKYSNLTNGRIVSLNAQGEYVPGVNTTGKYVMSFIMQHGGSNVDKVPHPYYDESNGNNEFPSIEVFPTDKPNVLGLPLCLGYEYITTEYDKVDAQTYIPGATPLTAVSSGPAAEWGKLKKATADDVVVGIVARKPGFGHPKYTDGTDAFGDSLQGGYNQQVAVTGNNSPALTFWGYTFPKSTLFGTPAASTGPA